MKIEAGSVLNVVYCLKVKTLFPLKGKGHDDDDDDCLKVTQNLQRATFVEKLFLA